MGNCGGVGRALQTHLLGRRGGSSEGAGSSLPEWRWQVRGEPRSGNVVSGRRSPAGPPRLLVGIAPGREFRPGSGVAVVVGGMSALLFLFPRNGLRFGISRRAPSDRRKGSAPSAREGATPGGSWATWSGTFCTLLPSLSLPPSPLRSLPSLPAEKLVAACTASLSFLEKQFDLKG